jgi:hypothetical protein
MDVIRFEAGRGAASAEDREVMLATVAGSGKDHPTLGLIEPAHRVLRMTAMDDAPDEANDPLSGQRPRTGSSHGQFAPTKPQTATLPDALNTDMLACFDRRAPARRRLSFLCPSHRGTAAAGCLSG